MAALHKTFRLVGTLIGAGLVAASVVSVFLIHWRTEPPSPPQPVRPLKTLIVGQAIPPAGRVYPGRIRANEEVDLAFQVAGPLIELLVRNGQEVAEGELLARIDPRDFQNILDAQTATAVQAEIDQERLEAAQAVGAATAMEADTARVTAEVAEANRKIAAKALEDTYLRAPFAGIIARTFVDNFQNVQARQAVLRLQDISHVDIEVNLPEQRIAMARATRDEYRFVVTFEYLPDRQFEVTLKEFATDADPATQTYAVIFTMPQPEDMLTLPGMTVTVNETRNRQPTEDASAGYLLPVSSVGIDGVGGYYVWLVTQAQGETYVTRRVNVAVGEMEHDSILVTEGVQAGDRIAAAGIHFLRDGQFVTLLDGRAGERVE